MATDELSPNLAEPVRHDRLVSWNVDAANAVEPPAHAVWRLQAKPWAKTEPEYGRSGPIYFAALGGTALAGALFPLVLLVTALVVAGPPNNLPAQAAMFVLIGGVVGFLSAALAALLVFPLIGAVQWLAGLYSWRVVMASIAGGWAGVVATQATVAQGLADQRMNFVGAMLTCIAMLMGQVGAGWAARWQMQRQAKLNAWHEPEPQARFSLRQLLGLTAAVAMLAALVSALRLPEYVYEALSLCLVFQAAMLAAYFVVVQRRRLPSAQPTGTA